MCSRVHFHIYSVCVHTSVYDSEGTCKGVRVHLFMLYYLPCIGLHVSPSTSVDSFGSLYREMCSNGLAMQRQIMKSCCQVFISESALQNFEMGSPHCFTYFLLPRLLLPTISGKKIGWARSAVPSRVYYLFIISQPCSEICLNGLTTHCHIILGPDFCLTAYS